MTVNAVHASIVRGAILFLPIILTLWFRWTALKVDKAEQKNVWGAYRNFSRFIIICTIVSWSAISRLGSGPSEVSFTVETAVLDAPNYEFSGLPNSLYLLR